MWQQFYPPAAKMSGSWDLPHYDRIRIITRANCIWIQNWDIIVYNHTVLCRSDVVYNETLQKSGGR